MSVEVKDYINLIVFFNYGNLQCIFYYNNVNCTFINVLIRNVYMYK